MSDTNCRRDPRQRREILSANLQLGTLEELRERAGDWTAPQALVDGREAIVVGLMGIDTKHSMHSEIHPVLGLAVKIHSGANRERWAFFARRSGNEGGCSQDLHHFDYDEMAFFFPNHGLANFTLDRERTIVRASGIPARTTFRKWPEGLVVKVGVGPRGSLGVVYGELEFCNGNCAPRNSDTLVPLIRSLAQPVDRFSVFGLNSVARRGPHPEGENEREEGRLEDVLAFLPREAGDQVRAKMGRLTPALVSREDLSRAISALASLSTPIARPSAPPPDVTIEEDQTPTAQRQARKLRRSEARTLSPAQSSPDGAGAAARRRTQTAIKDAIGEEQFRQLIEAVRRRGEQQ